MGSRKAMLKKEGLRSGMFLQYTVLFGIYTAGIFAVLILTHHVVMQYQDSYTQGIYRLVEFRNQIRSMLHGEGFSFWSWYEGTGLDEPLENFSDPFSLIASLFPDRYLELGFTFASLLRMYTGGLAFLLLGRENGLKKEQNITGALLYVFSACFMGIALRQAELMVNIYLFPLLVYSVDRIYKGKNPAPFVLTVAYYMVCDIYLSYMSALAIIMYIALRYFAYNDSFSLKDYAARLAGFIGYGIMGIMISAFSAAFSAFTIMRASTDSSQTSYGLLFDPDWYLSFGKILLGTGATYDYMDIGLPVLVIMLLPVAVRNINRRATNTIMACILFIMMMIPFFGSMFNGFGYVTLRWSYTFVLFATWSAAEQLDAELLRKKGGLVLPAAGLAAITVWTLVLYLAGETGVSTTGRTFIPVQLASGIVMLAILFFVRKKGSFNRAAAACVLAVTLVSLSAGWSAGFRNNLDDFARNAAVYKHLQESPLRVCSRIDDEGFFRTDSVDGVSRHAKLGYPANENIWWKSKNLFIYNSRIPESLTEFNVEMGNSYGYARRVYMLSNSNRMGLDFIYGVRYFLGSDENIMSDEDSDNYAGYGFKRIEDIDGVHVYKSKYDAGLGFVLDRAMRESDFRALGRPQKEQALLQAAVIPDDQQDKCGDVPLVSPGELDFDVRELPYTVTETDGLSLEDGKIVTDKKYASFTIMVKNIPEGQLMLSFDNLLRNSKDGSEGGSYEINAWDGRVTKTVINKHSRQGIDGLRNHELNMGSVSGSDEIRITFTDKGTYTFDSFGVNCMIGKHFDKYAAKCMKKSLKVSSCSDKKVTGTVDAGKGGILFLSIPAYDNWDVYVDGKKAEKISGLDITFTGVRVGEGEHKITLRYNNRYVKYGSLVSAFGVILLLLTLRIKKAAAKRTA